MRVVIDGRLFRDILDDFADTIKINSRYENNYSIIDDESI